MRRRGQLGSRQLKQFSASVKVLAGRLSVALLVLLICTISLFYRMREDRLVAQSQVMRERSHYFTAAIGTLLIH